jgi:branched-chain amino acid transport system permease protein
MKPAPWIAAAVAALAASPLVVGDYGVTLLSEVVILGLLAVSVNILLGYTGYISLGHALFFGAGAYVLGAGTLLLEWPTWLAMLAAVAVTAVLGLAVGAICMRVGRIQFLVITLAMAQLFYGVAVKTRVTGGDDGMPGVPRPDLAWLGLDTFSPSIFYLYVLVIAVVLLCVLYRMLQSPFGSVLVGIRENERRMIALGYSVALYKNLAFMLSGVVAGVAGVLFSQKLSFVNPDIMTWQVSGEAVLMAIIGGRQFFLGPVLGAALYVLLKAALSEITDEYIMIFGAVFMLVVALFGRGLAGFACDLAMRRRRAGARSHANP